MSRSFNFKKIVSMKKEKIDFNVALVDAFGEVVNEKRSQEDKEGRPVMLDTSIVNVLSHPHGMQEGKALDGDAIVRRMLLQQKVASRVAQEYSTDELAVIRESVVNLYNKRMLSVELAGAILRMTE